MHDLAPERESLALVLLRDKEEHPDPVGDRAEVEGGVRARGGEQGAGLRQYKGVLEYLSRYGIR